MSKSKIFILSCIAFAVGVFLASIFVLANFWLQIAMAIMVVVFYLGFSIKDPLIYVLAIGLFFVGFGAVRLNSSFLLNEYQQSFDSKYVLEGLIVEDPDIRENSQLLTFEPFNHKQKILITTTKATEYFYGDRVVIEGKIVEAKNFSDFDYQKYLERYNIYAVIKYPKILVLRTNQANDLKYYLLKTKVWLGERSAEKFTEPSKSLVLGVLIGARKTLPQTVVENFRATGLSHIVAVSGFNISIVVIFLGGLAYVFGRKISFYLTLLAIVGFAVIAGLSASVVRAGIMGILLLWAFKLGRPYAAGSAICFAASIMVFINPKILYWDVGFQLSFLATMGIVYGLDILEQTFKNIPKVWEIKSILLSSFSAIVATLPLSLAQFGQLPVYALLANILVLPVIPPLMLFGFLSLIPFLGSGFAFIAGILAEYIFWVVNIISSFPYAVIMLDFGGLGVLVAYSFIVLMYLWMKLKIRRGITVVEHNQKTC